MLGAHRAAQINLHIHQSLARSWILLHDRSMCSRSCSTDFLHVFLVPFLSLSCCSLVANALPSVEFGCFPCSLPVRDSACILTLIIQMFASLENALCAVLCLNLSLPLTVSISGEIASQAAEFLHDRYLFH